MDSEETLQIYSTSAPESPRQLWLPEVVATQPDACTGASSKPSSIPAEDGAGQDPGPPYPSSAIPALASGSRHGPNTAELLPAWARGM